MCPQFSKLYLPAGGCILVQKHELHLPLSSFVDVYISPYSYPVQRPNSWAKSRKKSEEFSSLLFTVKIYSFALRFLFFKSHATCYS
jgi:hypothetical protein